MHDILLQPCVNSIISSLEDTISTRSLNMNRSYNSSNMVDHTIEESLINLDNKSSVMKLPEYTATISLVFLTSILAVGVLGNLLVIIVILTSKETSGPREGRSTNLFLLNLSIADLLVLISCTPTALVEIVMRGDAWIMGKVTSTYHLIQKYLIGKRLSPIYVNIYTY